MNQRNHHGPGRRWVLPGAMGLTAAMVAMGTVLVLRARDRLPDPVAIHWGVNGQADGFASLTGSLWISGVVVLASAGLLVALSWVMDRSTRALMAGAAVGLAVFTSLLVYGSTLSQTDLADATDARLPVAFLAVAMGAGTASGLGYGLLARSAAPPLPEVIAPAPATAPRLDLAPGEPIATWTGAVTPNGRLIVALATLAIGTAVLLVWLSQWWVLMLPVACVLVLASFSATAVIDAEGFHLRSPARFRFLRIPLERVDHAEVIEVRALRDFGGWGVRVGLDGRRGMITRSGPALTVNRHGLPPVVVTLDGAAEAAAVLNTLLDRRAGGDSQSPPAGD